MGICSIAQKTEFEFELCVQTRLRKYSAAYQAQERECQNIANPFVRASGRDNTLAAERCFFLYLLRASKQQIKINVFEILFVNNSSKKIPI